jgi:Na+/H+ antiporter NhaD/arsenite permease-like protein
MKEYIALAIFVFIYVLIVGRIRFRIPIWVSMSIGAVLMIGLQIISPKSSLQAIQPDVIMFLFGMFSIVAALEKSGVLNVVAVKMLSRAKSANSLLAIFVVGMGVLSAFLVNDTIALVGIPIVAYISKHLNIRPAVFLLSLAFSITVGSVMMPIGNPQNLLIAIQSGIPLPFSNFLKFLAIPTILNLFLMYYVLRFYFKKDLALVNYQNLVLDDTKIENRRLAKISVTVLGATIAGFFIVEALHFLQIANISISAVALSGAAAIYATNKERVQIARSVDYSVLVFFAAMFVVTAAIWSSGAIPMIMKYIPLPNPHDQIQSNAIISATSVTLSQVLSNVPFVALYHYVMIDNGFTSNDISQWMMLAAASTVAGNLTILGAASNIIIIQASDSKKIKSFTFFEFLKIGSVVTAINLSVFYCFITLFSRF